MQLDSHILIHTHQPLELGGRRLDEALGFDAEHPLVRLLRFDRQHVAWRNQTDAQLIPYVREMRARALQRLAHDIQRRPSRQHRPERASDLQLQIGASGVAILARGFRIRAGGAGERLQAATGVDGPLEIDPRSHVVRNVGVNHAHAARSRSAR